MEAPERPQIKLKRNGFDKTVELAAVLLLVGLWMYTFTHYKALPAIIPTHFSGDGSVDGYGNKWMLFTLPFIGTLLYGMLSVFSRYPHKFNYMTTITQANAVKQYTIATQLLRVLKLAILLIFWSLDYQTVQVAQGSTSDFSNWFILLDMSLIFVPLFYFLIQFSKNS